MNTPKIDNSSLEYPTLTDEFVKKYSYLVNNYAYYYCNMFNFKIEIDELKSYAYLGLIDAINKYKNDRHTSFETYASFRIKGTIIDNIRNNNFVSRSYLLKIKELNKAEDEYFRANNAEISDDELARVLNISIDDINKIRNYKEVNKLVPLEELEGKKFSDEYDKIFELAELRLIFNNILSKLNEREKKVIYYYYYLQFGDREISEYMKVSTTRACQIRNNALRKLRTNKNKQLLKDYKYI